MSVKWQSITLFLCESFTDKCAQIPRSCERLLSQHPESLNQLFTSRTGSRAASCSLDFISSCCCYCIVYPVFLPPRVYPSWTLQTPRPSVCAKCSFPFTLKMRSHVFGKRFNPHLLILGLISIPEILSPVLPGCTAAFLRSDCWKVYFCADNISYIPCLLTAEKWTIVWSSRGLWWLRVTATDRQCKRWRIKQTKIRNETKRF